MNIEKAYKETRGLSEYESVKLEAAVNQLETYYRNPMELLSLLVNGEIDQITTPYSIYRLGKDIK